MPYRDPVAAAENKKAYKKKWMASDGNRERYAEYHRNRHLRATYGITQAEYDVPYWFQDLESFMFWLMSVPWPEEIELQKHWQAINQVLETSWTERGIETNEHRGLLIVQKL